MFAGYHESDGHFSYMFKIVITLDRVAGVARIARVLLRIIGIRIIRLLAMFGALCYALTAGLAARARSYGDCKFNVGL